MRLHIHIIQQIINCLREIHDVPQPPADKVIERHLKLNKKWGARDRKFFAESVYDIIRWKKLLWFLLEVEMEKKSSTDLLSSLSKLWATYWFHYRQKISPTPEEWGLLTSHFPELKSLDFKKIQERELLLSNDSTSHKRSIKQSISSELDSIGVEELGPTRWENLLKALNQSATVDLRVNAFVSTPEKLQDALLREGVETLILQFQIDFSNRNEFLSDTSSLSATSSSFHRFLCLKERKNVFITNAFKKGAFEVQDRSSQHIAFLLNPQPGERIIDACAGAGGKTLHIANLMKNKGKILALDIHEWKLKELQKRASRNKVDIIETRHLESRKVWKRLKESADRVLLDVPCSGLGVLRRNPDTKWKINGPHLLFLRQQQHQLLEDYSALVKSGGFMVYSTCSILPSENEIQIETFLNKHSQNWELITQIHLNPGESEGAGDGFYGALLFKKRRK